MNVTMVVPRFAPDIGGIESASLSLAAGLVRIGHAVTVVTQGASSLPRRHVVEHQGAELLVLRAPCVPYVPSELPAPGLVSLVRQASVGTDVVHAHSYHTLVAPAAAFAARRVPLVVSLHFHQGGHSRVKGALHRLYTPFGRRFVAAADAVLANSQTEADAVHAKFGSAVPVHVIRHGLDPVTFTPCPPTGIPTVLSVCRLEPYKRVDTLIEAVARTKRPVRLVVAGDGPDRSRLEQLATQLSANVEFTGRVSDERLAELWSQAHVVMSASEQESFGLVVAQALHAGVRCVASSIGAHRELVDLSSSGVLVDGWDPSGWAAALDGVVNGPAPAPFPFDSWDRVAARVADVYASTVR